MWLRFIKQTPEHKVGDIIWVDDDKEGQKHLDLGEAVRCLGPDGVAFDEAAPEDVEAQIKAENALKSKKK